MRKQAFRLSLSNTCETPKRLVRVPLVLAGAAVCAAIVDVAAAAILMVLPFFLCRDVGMPKSHISLTSTVEWLNLSNHQLKLETGQWAQMTMLGTASGSGLPHSSSDLDCQAAQASQTHYQQQRRPRERVLSRKSRAHNMHGLPGKAVNCV